MMWRFSRSGSLSLRKVVLAIQALSVLLIVRLGLWVLPPRLVLQRVDRLLASSDSLTYRKGGFAPRQIARAVTIVSRRVPRASCLTQALAGQILLARHGHRSRLRIGVARGPRGEFQAHAWVETDAGPVLGGGELERFSTLPDLQQLLRDPGQEATAGSNLG